MSVLKFRGWFETGWRLDWRQCLVGAVGSPHPFTWGTGLGEGGLGKACLSEPVLELVRRKNKNRVLPACLPWRSDRQPMTWDVMKHGATK